MSCFAFFFFFNDTATTEIYTLSLHDALPISRLRRACRTRSKKSLADSSRLGNFGSCSLPWTGRDRKSTRLNSSHLVISYAVFCLKKKKLQQTPFTASSVTDCSARGSRVRTIV